MSNQAEMSNIDKFELLSAYLDGEVDARERQQVEALLRTDAAFKAQYQRMQEMHRAIEQLPLAETPLPVDDLADRVFAKIDSRQQSRWLKIGGGALAATLVAAGAGVTGLWHGWSSPTPQIAQVSLPTETGNILEIMPNPAPLMVALNDSIVQISPNSKPSVQHDDDELGILDSLDVDDI
jgi:anti-sigma-K factor RskA